LFHENPGPGSLQEAAEHGCGVRGQVHVLQTLRVVAVRLRDVQV
jgi:hypothetical protein